MERRKVVRIAVDQGNQANSLVDTADWPKSDLARRGEVGGTKSSRGSCRRSGWPRRVRPIKDQADPPRGFAKVPATTHHPATTRPRPHKTEQSAWALEPVERLGGRGEEGGVLATVALPIHWAPLPQIEGRCYTFSERVLWWFLRSVCENEESERKERPKYERKVGSTSLPSSKSSDSSCPHILLLSPSLKRERVHVEDLKSFRLHPNPPLSSTACTHFISRARGSPAVSTTNFLHFVSIYFWMTSFFFSNL